MPTRAALNLSGPNLLLSPPLHLPLLQLVACFGPVGRQLPDVLTEGLVGGVGLVQLLPQHGVDLGQAGAPGDGDTARASALTKRARAEKEMRGPRRAGKGLTLAWGKGPNVEDGP